MILLWGLLLQEKKKNAEKTNHETLETHEKKKNSK